MGGLSAVRSVSLRSGDAVAPALEGEGYRVTRIDVGRDVASASTRSAPDVCFNALHGRFGEDGIIQGSWRWRRSLYAFGRAGLGACHAQGEREARRARVRCSGR